MSYSFGHVNMVLRAYLSWSAEEAEEESDNDNDDDNAKKKEKNWRDFTWFIAWQSIYVLLYGTLYKGLL